MPLKLATTRDCGGGVQFTAVISGIVAVYMGAGFNFYTGVSTPVLQYFAISFALFFGVYVVYFGATYVGFIRNIEE